MDVTDDLKMPTPPRLRRTPAEARAAILHSAEILLMNGGPATLRLQQVARHAGISHPTLLHHFGNREGLIKALNEKTAVELVTYVEAFADELGSARPNLIRHIFETFRDGFAQRLIWLTMSAPGEGTRRGPVMDRMLETMHRTRTAMARLKGHPDPEPGDTEFAFHLILVAAIGDAVVGDAFRRPEMDETRGYQRAAFINKFRQLLRP
jgi:AcrR family transcriptional regulator